MEPQGIDWDGVIRFMQAVMTSPLAYVAIAACTWYPFCLGLSKIIAAWRKPPKGGSDDK